MVSSGVLWLLARHPVLTGVFALAAAMSLRLAMAMATAMPAPRRAGAALGSAVGPAVGSAAESGTALLDFVLTLPFFAMSVLIVVQTALLLNARLVVGYAAFAAARSAVVWLPAGDVDAATGRATNAAALACLPISPGAGGALSELSGADLALVFVAGSNPLQRIGRAGGKYQYALGATTVELTGTEEPAQAVPITATVTYRFWLSVPYADLIFAPLLGGTLPAPPGWSGGTSLRYADLAESFTLVNQGKLHALS